MALTNVRYLTGQPDLVIQVSECPANSVENTTPASGSVSANSFAAKVLKAPNNTTQPGEGYAWGMYDWYVLYPVDSDGSQPDAEIRWAFGDRQPNDLIAAAGYDNQFFPEPRHLRGGKREQVHQGVSLRKLYASSGSAPNLPLQIAGNLWVPASQSFGLRVRSSAGWGQSGTVKAPLIFLGFLDIYTDADIREMWPWLVQQTTYGMDYGPGGNVRGQFVWPDLATTPTSPEVVGQFPGGAWQDQVTYELKSATNSQALTANQRYPYTQKTNISGATTNNVALDYDLGHAFRNTQQAFVPIFFGLRFDSSLYVSGSANPEAYLSFTVDGETIPNPNENGVLITGGTNLIQWGSTPPILPDDGEFLPVSDIGQFVKTINVGQNTAPQVYSTTAKAANTVRILQGGYRLKGKSAGMLQGQGAQQAIG